MTKPPPIGIFDRNLRQSMGKAYRQAYTAGGSAPHRAGMSAATEAFVMRFPYQGDEVVRMTVKMILSAIEASHPGWLSNDAPKRYPASNEDAAAEVADIGRRWL